MIRFWTSCQYPHCRGLFLKKPNPTLDVKDTVLDPLPGSQSCRNVCLHLYTERLFQYENPSKRRGCFHITVNNTRSVTWPVSPVPTYLIYTGREFFGCQLILSILGVKYGPAPCRFLQLVIDSDGYSVPKKGFFRTSFFFPHEIETQESYIEYNVITSDLMKYKSLIPCQTLL